MANQHLPYTAREDRAILNLRNGGMSFADMVDALPDRTASSLAQRYYRLCEQSGQSRIGRRQTPRKARTCLVGGHPFMARIDRIGRFLEYSCRDCKKTLEYRESIFA